MRSSLGFILILLAAAALGQAPPPNTALATPVTLDDLISNVEHVQAANHERARAYVATREFEFFDKDKPQPSSRVIAEVQYQPPCTKKYAIRQATGNGQGERVVRHILDSEAEMSKKAEESDITRRNYDFRFAGNATLGTVPVFVLDLHPKRDDKRLVEGKAWVDARSYQILRVEGKLAQNPSWWLKEVHVRLDYGTAGGQWLQTDTTAVAQVRFFGQHTLISRALNVQTGAQVATTRRPTVATTQRNHPRPAAPAAAAPVTTLIPE